MPTPPAVGEQNRLGETWDGQRWTGGHSAPMINMPPRTPSGRTNQDDLELLKQFLTTGGTIAGGVIGGPPGAILGGAAGRMLGHVPETFSQAPGEGSFGTEAALGAMEGGAQEMLPAVAGPIARYGGRGLKAIGRMMLDNPSAPYRDRAIMAAARGYGAHEFGAPAFVQGAASVGPIVASEAGSGLERAGEALGTGTLSQRVRGGLDALMERLRPAASHGERMAAAADDYAGQKAADAAQTAARERASGVTHFGEDIPTSAVIRTPEPAEPVFSSWSPRGTDEPGPLGFSLDHLDMLRGLRKSGFTSDTAARISGQDLADPALDALRRYARKPYGADVPEMAVSAAPSVAVDPAEALAAKLGSPTDADMAARLADRKTTGLWKR